MHLHIRTSFLFLITALTAPATSANDVIEAMPLAQLEARRDAIKTELSQLASFSLRSGVGSNGYRSVAHLEPDHTEWLEIDLGKNVPVDLIAVVPTLVRHTKDGFISDGFPTEFRILAGTSNDREDSILIASFNEADQLLPRIAPVLVPTNGLKASWIRIEASRVPKRVIDEKYALQLSEVFVFGGNTNWALRRPVKSSEPISPLISPWSARYLTDGATPYFMDAATGDKGIAFINAVGGADQPSLTIDLGEAKSISQINLHAVDQSDTVPQSFLGDFGIPYHFKLEGSTEPDFTDAVTLLDARHESIYDISPIMSWNIPEFANRYIRLTALDPYIFNNGRDKGTRIGFAEIELLSKGHNLARGKTVSTNFFVESEQRPLSRLTDGLNFYGNILPIREWLEQLTRRHDLEAELPLITAELEKRYTRQKANLNRLAWLAAILTVGIALTILIERLMRQRQVAQIKQRLAADLHDELGANVHSMGMLSDLADDADSPEELQSIHKQIWDLSQRTGTAVRYCTNMLEAEGLYLGLIEDMERAAQRITVSYQHDFSAEGSELTKQLRPRTQIDLFLFYKECLINICRHSNATQLRTRIIAESNTILLTVCDNGQGIQKIPASLERRARLMQGKIKLETPTEGGTAIQLKLKIRRNWLARLLSSRA